VIAFPPPKDCGSFRKWERWLKRELKRIPLEELEAHATAAKSPTDYCLALVLISMKETGLGWTEANVIVRAAFNEAVKKP
jgi:hypothetical protein